MNETQFSKIQNCNKNNFAFTVIDVSLKKHIKIVPVKKISKQRKIKSYYNKCSEEISLEEKIIYEDYFNDDSINNLNNRTFITILRIYIKNKIK